MGELARKPGAPKVAETPLELLTPRPEETPCQDWIFLGSGAGAVFGLVSSGVMNVFQRRPLWASVPRHILFIGLGFFLTKEGLSSLYQSRAEEDAIYKHYISLHPEDFPPFERKRWAEVYVPFHPVR